VVSFRLLGTWEEPCEIQPSPALVGEFWGFCRMRIYHHFLEARDLTRVVEDRRDSAIDFRPAVLAAEDPWRAHSTLATPHPSRREPSVHHVPP
jgi:hypothetical protein